MWSKGDMENAYSSPILITAGGRDQIVNFSAREVSGSDAGTGDVLWSIEHRTMHDIHAATPAWCEEASVLVVSSGYDGGALDIQVGRAVSYGITNGSECTTRTWFVQTASSMHRVAILARLP